MTDDADQVGFIVAGMHRSSTSLITSLIASSGFWMAPDQLPPADDNPKGYFEDRPMHLLHRQLLEHYDTAWDLSPRLRKLRRRELDIPSHLDAEANRLAGAYRDHDRWVWKNPRATLFLEEWARRFPEAIVVVCVRRPDAVVDSMIRRKDYMRVHGRGVWVFVRRIFRGLSIWRSYNLMAYRFVKRNPDRAIVVRIPEDLPMLERASGERLFDPKMLRRPRPRVRVPALVAWRCRLLHMRLTRRADPERLAELLQSPVADRRREAGRASTRVLVTVAASTGFAAATNLGVSLMC